MGSTVQEGPSGECGRPKKSIIRTPLCGHSHFSLGITQGSCLTEVLNTFLCVSFRLSRTLLAFWHFRGVEDSDANRVQSVFRRSCHLPERSGEPFHVPFLRSKRLPRVGTACEEG